MTINGTSNYFIWNVEKIDSISKEFLSSKFVFENLKLDVNLADYYTIYTILRTPWNTVQGGRGLIPEMIQVCDYDILIVLVELNTLI